MSPFEMLSRYSIFFNLILSRLPQELLSSRESIVEARLFLENLTDLFQSRVTKSDLFRKLSEVDQTLNEGKN